MTFAENEIVTLFLSLGVLLFFLANLVRIREIDGYRFLVGSLLAYVTAMIFTLLEGLAWGEGFNFLEHLCYLVSAALLAAWIARLARPKRGEW
jgi:hypothetical protein